MSKCNVAHLPKGVQCITAPNPSAMTGDGTNTYLFHGPSSFVLDPGPLMADHMAALQSAIAGPVKAILISHPHLDHSQNSRELAKLWNCPIWAFDPGPRIEDKVQGGMEFGIDLNFRCDRALGDGEVITNGAHRLEVLHTPGHFDTHIAFLSGDHAFTADLIFADTTTMIAPPEGDFLDFLTSLDRLDACNLTRLWPAHGRAITEPPTRIKEVKEHRLMRHQAILAALGPQNIALNALVAQIYKDIPPTLIPAATQTAMAHLLALQKQGKVALVHDNGEEIWIKRTDF